MKDIHIYLSGSIRKGVQDKRDSFWTEDDIASIAERLKPLRVVFLNPSTRNDDLSDVFATFGRDLFQVTSADIVLVDARDRRGIGIGAEMVVAKMHRLPVISLAPLNTHYHRSDFIFMDQHIKSWVHPFIASLSDAVVESLTQVTQTIIGHFSNSRCLKVKGPEVVDGAIAHYLQTQLHRDTPMRSLVETSDILRSRLERAALKGNNTDATHR